MTDIVERLQNGVVPDELRDAEERMREAADEIERLRKIEDEWASLSQDNGKAEREIERLRAELATLRSATASVQSDQRAAIDAARELLRCMTAERDALRVDAERYRWLRATSASRPDFYSGAESWMVSRAQGGVGQNFFGDKIDAAIDAAMANDPSK